MTRDDVLENVKGALRISIAAKLDLAPEEYSRSLDAQNAVNRLLTNVMSIAYNGGDIKEVLSELCMARHYGQENDPEVIAYMHQEVDATCRKLRPEIEAFYKMHRLNMSNTPPATVWETVREMISVPR